MNSPIGRMTARHREITYTDWEKQADGTYVKVEKTVTLTKDEAKNLLDQLETSLDKADPRGNLEETESPYQLVEGRILVSGAEIEIPSNSNGENEDETTESTSLGESFDKFSELEEQIFMLKREIIRLSHLMDDMLPSVGQDVTYTTYEKTGELSYEAVEVTKTVNQEGLAEIIQNLYELEFSMRAHFGNKPPEPYSYGPGSVDIPGENEVIGKAVPEYSSASPAPSDNKEMDRPVQSDTLNENKESSDSQGKLGSEDNSIN